MSFIKHGLPTAFDFCFIFQKMGAVFKLLQRYELLCHVGLSIQSFYSYFPVTPGIHVSTIGKWPSIQSLILQPPEDFPVEGLLPPLCVTLYWAAMVTYAQCHMHYDTECHWELIPPVEGQTPSVLSAKNAPGLGLHRCSLASLLFLSTQTEHLLDDLALSLCKPRISIPCPVLSSNF